jgi:hypothetical protein
MAWLSRSRWELHLRPLPASFRHGVLNELDRTSPRRRRPPPGRRRLPAKRQRAPPDQGNGARDALLHEELALLRDGIESLPGRIADETAASPLREAWKPCARASPCWANRWRRAPPHPRKRRGRRIGVHPCGRGRGRHLRTFGPRWERWPISRSVNRRALAVADPDHCREVGHLGARSAVFAERGRPRPHGCRNPRRAPWRRGIPSASLDRNPRTDLRAPTCDKLSLPVARRRGRRRASGPCPGTRGTGASPCARPGICAATRSAGSRRRVAEVGRELSEAGARAGEDRVVRRRGAGFGAGSDGAGGIRSAVGAGAAGRTAFEPRRLGGPHGPGAGGRSATAWTKHRAPSARTRWSSPRRWTSSPAPHRNCPADSRCSPGKGSKEGLVDPSPGAERRCWKRWSASSRAFPVRWAPLLSESDLRTRETMAELAARLPGLEGATLPGSEG